MQFNAHVRSVTALESEVRVVGKRKEINKAGLEVEVDEVEYTPIRERVTIEIDGAAPALGDDLGFEFAPPAELFIDSPPGIYVAGQALTVAIELA